MAFTITTAAITVTRSGTSFTIDVTAANLSEDLNVKDFTVLDQTNQIILSNVNFTKTSTTILAYSGPDIGTDISLEIRRATPVERFQIQQFGNKFSSTTYNEEIDRILGKIFEIVEFGVGDDTFFIPTPQNQAYGVAWATDNVRGRTANVLYDQMELYAETAQNEVITGDWVVRSDWAFSPEAPSTSQVTVGPQATFAVDGPMIVGGSSANFTGTTAFTKGTPPTTDASLEVANTAFVYNALDDIFVGMIAHFNQGVTNRWLLCNGTSFSASTYPLLASRLGGNTLPNYLGRFIVSADGGTYVLGATGGNKDAIIVAHNHGLNDAGHFHGPLNGGSFFVDVGGAGTFTLQSDIGSQHTAVTQTSTNPTGISVATEGVSGTNANLPPYLALNIYIYAGRPQS